MTAPKDTLIRRSLRRFTLGSGPLKRRSDRVQAIARVTVVFSFLLASPIAVGVATATTTHLQSVASGQAAERTLVRAVLVEDATVPEGSTGTDGGPPVARVPVAAVWSLPGGEGGQASRINSAFVLSILTLSKTHINSSFKNPI